MTITNAHRAQIRMALLRNKFAAEFLGLAEKRQTLAYDVYRKVVDFEKFDKLKEPWVTRSKTGFLVATEAGVLGFDVSGRMLSNPREVKSFFGHNLDHFWHDLPGMGYKIVLPNTGQNATFAYELHPDIGKLVTIQQEKCDNLLLSMIPIARDIDGKLGNTKSVSKLLQRWPELEPFLPDGVYALKDTALVKNDDLNRTLGLPA